MSRNFVHAAKRLKVLFTVNHTAGDLVYVGGFYGIVQDNVVVATDPYGTLILEGAWAVSRVPSTTGMGSVLSAPATEIATSLPLGVRGGVATVAATTGWNPVGRLIATSNATVGKLQLANPNLAF